MVSLTTSKCMANGPAIITIFTKNNASLKVSYIYAALRNNVPAMYIHSVPFQESSCCHGIDVKIPLCACCVLFLCWIEADKLQVLCFGNVEGKVLVMHDVFFLSLVLQPYSPTSNPCTKLFPSVFVLWFASCCRRDGIPLNCTVVDQHDNLKHKRKVCDLSVLL